MIQIAIVITAAILMVVFLVTSHRKAHKPLPAHMVTVTVTLDQNTMARSAYAAEDRGEMSLLRKSRTYRRDMRIMGAGKRGVEQLYNAYLHSPVVRSALRGRPAPAFRVVGKHTHQGEELAGSVRQRNGDLPMLTVSAKATPYAILHELAHYAVDYDHFCNGADMHGHDMAWRRVYVGFVNATYPGRGAEMFSSHMGVS